MEEFFRSLQDLLVFSLNPSLSFDSAEFLSRRLDGFERTLSVLSSRLRVSYWTSEVQLLSYLDTPLFIVSQRRQHCEYLFRFARGEGRRISSPAKSSSVTKYFQQTFSDLLKYRASGGLEHLIPQHPLWRLKVVLPPPPAKRNKVSPRNVAFVD